MATMHRVKGLEFDRMIIAGPGAAPQIRARYGRSLPKPGRGTPWNGPLPMSPQQGPGPTCLSRGMVKGRDAEER
jgi:superfamily I DNA/RNA helicase